jgi:DNA repair exonuclease SbcCD ATPase subunit
MDTSRRGSAVFVVIIILAVAAVVFFFVSKPFQTRVKEATRQATEWTSENIQEDPVGYLTWARDEVQQSEKKLNAGLLSLKTRHNEIERLLKAKSADKQAYDELLKEAKTVYREAADDGTWPAVLRGAELNEQQLKERIVATSEHLASIDAVMNAYKQTTAALVRRINEVNAKLDEVRKLKKKLDTDIEIARVKESVDGINAINDRLAAIGDTTDALISSGEETEELEPLLEPTGDERFDAEFERIMQE